MIETMTDVPPEIDGVRGMLTRGEYGAVVTDLAWMRAACRLAAFAVPHPLRVFGTHERADAVAWLLALREGPRITTRTYPGTGVVVVEVDRALRTEDVDALAAVDDERRPAGTAG